MCCLTKTDASASTREKKKNNYNEEKDDNSQTGREKKNTQREGVCKKRSASIEETG